MSGDSPDYDCRLFFMLGTSIPIILVTFCARWLSWLWLSSLFYVGHLHPYKSRHFLCLVALLLMTVVTFYVGHLHPCNCRHFLVPGEISDYDCRYLLVLTGFIPITVVTVCAWRFSWWWLSLLFGLGWLHPCSCRNFFSRVIYNRFPSRQHVVFSHDCFRLYTCSHLRRWSATFASIINSNFSFTILPMLTLPVFMRGSFYSYSYY